MDVSTVKKYKNKTYKALHKTAKDYFHKFIRLRDTDENGVGFCISSGRLVRYGTKECQAGHFYPAGTFKALEFDEDNVHVQSLADNYFRSANLNEYRPRLIKKIGIGNFDDLVRLAETTKNNHFEQNRFFMIDIIERYKAKCKELAGWKNFEVK